MRLQELAYVIGDEGGMHRHVHDAIENMKHHSMKHKDKNIRELCAQAAGSLRAHVQNPLSLYDDPHTFYKIVSQFHGEPDERKIKHAVHALGSYTPTDNE